jgi:hypothetical protein
MCFYVRVAGPLAQNLLQRLGTEMADVAVGMKRRLLYPLRRLLSRPDDVLPPDCSTEPEGNVGSTGENHGHDYELARIVRDLRVARVWHVVRWFGGWTNGGAICRGQDGPGMCKDDSPVFDCFER